MPSKSLLLLDNDIILRLHERRLWDAVVSQYSVSTASIIVNREASYYFIPPNVKTPENKHALNLSDPAVRAVIEEKTATPKEQSVIQALLKKPGIRLDDGELECITILKRENGLLFCTADKAAIRAAAYLEFEQRLKSLDEVLASISVTFPADLDGTYLRKNFGRLITDGILDRLKK